MVFNDQRMPHGGQITECIHAKCGGRVVFRFRPDQLGVISECDGCRQPFTATRNENEDRDEDRNSL